jgi:hypothetical protein
MSRVGIFTKNLNQNNLHIGSGWISSTSSFTPQKLKIADVTYQSYSDKIISGVNYKFYTFDDVGLGLGSAKYFSEQTANGIYSISKDFVKKEISIPSGPESVLKFNMKFIFSNNVSQALENKGYITQYPPGNFLDSPGYLIKVNTVNSLIGFRVKANGVVVYSRTTSYTGDVEITLPAGTTNVSMETYDSVYGVNPPVHYKITGNPSLIINNVRIQIPNKPSIPIGNSTKSNTAAEHLDPIRNASISISNVSNNGYYDLIEGQFHEGVAVDYFVVSDTFAEPNILPRSYNRNVCLEFDNIDYSKVDIDKKIELLIDVIDIDTSVAEEAYDDLGVTNAEVSEFYKYGERAKIKVNIALSDFPTGGIAAISAGNTQVSTIPPTKFKGGLNVYDITQAVIQSIQNSRQKIVVWLSYDKAYARDKYVAFKVGNTENNKPRIRYFLK